ncbi:MAG: hypothetical protein E7052_02845 [Lentisphaerae bacterium]|nr:hypothetical protein [Lentisphaerota bacterium]
MLARIACMFLTVGVMFSANSNHIQGEIMSKKNNPAADMLTIPALPEVLLTPDGEVKEDFWSKAAVIEPQLLYRQNGLTSKAKTVVRLCSDPNNLYIGIVCEEPDAVVVDENDPMPWKSDSVEIFIAGNRHPAWYRQIVVGASGKKFSQMIHESQWQSKTCRSKNFWSAELVIPLDKLGKIASGDLRMNILRTRRCVKEIITWQPLKARALEVETFGKVALPGAIDVLRYGAWTFQIKSRSAGLAYESSVPVDGCFYYRKQGSKKWLQTAGNASTEPLLRSCYLTQLEPDTIYEYYVPGMKKIAGFRTLSEQNGDFSAVLIPDLHCRALYLENLLKRADVQKSDLLFLLGDQLAASLAREYHYDGYLKTIFEYWNKPFYAVFGNHEGRGEAADSFYDIFAGGKKAAFDAFSHKGVFFVILDTDRDFDMSEEYKKLQIGFLKKVTATDEFKRAEFRVLLLHVPISFFWRRWGNENYAIFSALPPETRQMFDLALSGHIHQYTRCLAGDKTITSEEPTIHGMKAERQLPFPEFTAPELALIQLKKFGKTLQVNIFDQHGKLIEDYIVKPKR